LHRNLRRNKVGILDSVSGVELRCQLIRVNPFAQHAFQYGQNLIIETISRNIVISAEKNQRNQSINPSVTPVAKN